MNADLAALRRAVLESPADDNPRRVYADACLESGDPATAAHGELILLQLHDEPVTSAPPPGDSATGRRAFCGR